MPLQVDRSVCENEYKLWKIRINGDKDFPMDINELMNGLAEVQLENVGIPKTFKNLLHVYQRIADVYNKIKSKPFREKYPHGFSFVTPFTINDISEDIFFVHGLDWKSSFTTGEILCILQNNGIINQIIPSKKPTCSKCGFFGHTSRSVTCPIKLAKK